MRRTIALTTIAVVLAVGTPMIATVAIDPGTECERIAKWATVHAKKYPATFGSLTQLPIEYRRATFAAQTSEQRAQLWRDHIAQFLEDPDLTPPQRQWLITLRTFIQPDLFANRGLYDAQVRTLETQAKALFGQGRAKLLLATLGPVKHTFPTNRTALAASAATWLRSVASPAAEEFSSCTCSQASDWCSPWPTSPSARCSDIMPCVLVPDACGTFWVYDCDGNCGPE